MKVGAKRDSSCENGLIYVKLRKWGNCTLTAACDVDLLGKVLKEGKIVFEVGEEFYKGSQVTVEEAISLIGQSSIVNMIGHLIVSKAIAAGLVHPAAVLNIQGVPHAQIVKL
jgi:hypothetical protein